MPGRPKPAAATAHEAPGSIQTAWTDAFGVRRTVGVRTRRKLRVALRGHSSRRSALPDPVVVGRRGEPLPAGPELVLEDGTLLGRVARIPADVPYGYHLLRSERHEQLLLVAPQRCALLRGYREWAWAVRPWATVKFAFPAARA